MVRRALSRARGGRRWRLGRSLAAVSAVLAGVSLAAPALGAGGLLSSGADANASVSCPSGAAPSGGTQIAGYSLSVLGAGFHYELDSKGLLPVGDPSKGQVMEFDVPFARTTVSGGPVVDSLASAAYPGDVAAHLGSALGTFGFPFPVPNDPVLAESTYPPSPGRAADETFSPPANAGGSQAGVGSAHSTAQQNQASADSSIGDSAFGSGGPPLISAGSSQSHTDVHLSTSCVDGTATSVTGPIDIAGLIQVSGVSASAASRSDGTTGVPRASLTIGNVTVAGQKAYIDRNGVHVIGSPPAGQGLLPSAQTQLDQALQAAGMAVHLVDPSVTTKGGLATADSGGLAITIDRQLPATGVPGVPALILPGLPPVPLGTPGAPLHAEVVFGAAQVSANATTAPAFSVGPLGGNLGGGGLPAQPGVSSGAPDLGTTSGAVLASGSADLGQGPERLVAQAAGPPHGSPIPVGWVIIGVALAFVAASPLMSYARWQLLEGRI
ncbi:MAG TPA: hypothetical protein VFA11_18680 [Acidimicrobiales bacterium]|nr:hypothetical protein [Acidimicrobiales bacterium]